jgi:hypothetical protein
LNTQRGGAFTVSGWIAMALLSLAVAEGVYIRHLQDTLRQRFLHNFFHVGTPLQLPTTEIHGPSPKDDEFSFHAFPETREVCDGFNTICWIRI